MVDCSVCGCCRGPDTLQKRGSIHTACVVCQNQTTTAAHHRRWSDTCFSDQRGDWNNFGLTSLQRIVDILARRYTRPAASCTPVIVTFTGITLKTLKADKFKLICNYKHRANKLHKNETNNKNLFLTYLI